MRIRNDLAEKVSAEYKEKDGWVSDEFDDTNIKKEWIVFVNNFYF